ncbi:MAG: hypothetical protein QM796_19905 [Chthoniobacteraceae bacterium]
MQVTASQTTPLSNLTVETKPAQTSTVSTQEPAATDTTDSVSLNRVSSLLTELQSDPKVRPEVVARGRMLAEDPNYPPQQVINALASLISSTGSSSAS